MQKTPDADRAERTFNSVARHLSRATFVAFLAAIPAALDAQSGIRRIASNHISTDNPASPHVETHLAVNQQNPNHLLATSMVVGAKGNMLSNTYVSFDGGRRWTRGRLAIDTGIVLEGDPLVYFNNKGTAFYVALGKVNGANRSIILRSTDGGRTWSSPTVLAYADREWMAIDTSRGPFGGRVYFTGTGITASRDSAGQRATAPFFARSDDDGRTFPFRSLIGWEANQAPMNAVPLDPVVTSAGVLVMGVQSADQALVDRYARDSLNPRRLGIIVSNDGGDSFGQSRYSTTYRLTLRGGTLRRARSNASTGYARVVIDASTRFRDRIYIMSHSYDQASGRIVVLVWRTSDLGLTWQTTIASDAPAGDIANPAIAVNRDGVVAVTWNDRRDAPDRQCFHVHAAISTDGGETFRSSERLSTKPACTNDARNWITFGLSGSAGSNVWIQTGASVPGRFANGGDTQGLMADATGVFHAAWISGETGVLQLWHSSFSADAPVARRDTGAAKPANDITQDIRFHVVDTKLDFATHTWTVTTQIENRSGRPLKGPFRAEMVEFLNELDRGGGLANIAVANADNGRKGVGAVWRFEAPNNILPPRGRTSPRTLRFTFDGGVPDVPLGYLSPEFRVYNDP